MKMTQIPVGKTARGPLGTSQVIISDALEGVVPMEVLCTHVVGRAGITDPSEADRAELTLERERETHTHTHYKSAGEGLGE